MSANDPAFPVVSGHTGLSKRELIAAMALQGLTKPMLDNSMNAPFVAECAVALADALIAALEKS